MTLPASGAISMSQVNTELEKSSTATITLNDAAVRSLFGKASGQISMSDGYGKASAFSGTITTNQQQLNLATWATNNGWNGSSVATITINSGVYIWSDDTSVAALTTGSFPGGLTLINNGYIMGKGGKGGGNGPTGSGSTTGLVGGPAINLGTNITINSTSGYIAGGGGGGGAGSSIGNLGGGGGAGGGPGGDGYFFNSSTGVSGLAYGGAGGSVGASGSNGQQIGNSSGSCAGGGGGGRIFGATTTSGPSVTNKGISGGYGGQGGGTGSAFGTATGGSGGGDGISGGNGNTNTGNTSGSGGGGGGFGAAGGYGTGVNGTFAGGGAGKAVNLNGYSITWTNGFPSTRVFGAVS